MKNQRYRVELTETERKTLQSLVSKGEATARSIRRAQILLWADEQHPVGKMKDMEIAKQL